MILLLAPLLMLFAGCATTAPQATAILKESGNLPRSAMIEGVPFINQEIGHCGPATLAMASKAIGHETSAEHLAPMVMTTARGSYQESMIAAARREGLYAVRLTGMPAVLREVADGYPVIIFENLGLSWYQQWHYALVTGYDLNRAEIIAHSGPTPSEKTDLKVFERSWKHSDYWALVVRPPGTVTTNASEVENLRAAAGLELANQLDAAEKSYLAILKKWPTSLGALVGLGNLSYKKSDFKQAVSFLDQAVQSHPESSAAKHNLELARQALARQ